MKNTSTKNCHWPQSYRRSTVFSEDAEQEVGEVGTLQGMKKSQGLLDLIFQVLLLSEYQLKVVVAPAGEEEEEGSAEDAGREGMALGFMKRAGRSCMRSITGLEPNSLADLGVQWQLFATASVLPKLSMYCSIEGIRESAGPTTLVGSIRG
ncbi:hypothetical protein B296_00016444 [Ensete ventricosum]|uniref:Uncharacterized protein n=1 Tax=Ensete ventricosum TaxID=4639 RepID=A0A427AY75_ENSVE|nr:hypothetical protein B296_00016444 [Ensete ventricosum]